MDSNFNRVLRVIKRHFFNELKNINSNEMIQDYKTAILIYCQEKYKNLPCYELISQTGPDHESTFEVRILINGDEYGRGKGKSKKDAEQQAAREAIIRMIENTYEEK